MKKFLILLVACCLGYCYFYKGNEATENADLYEFKYNNHDYTYYRGDPNALHSATCFYCRKTKFINKVKKMENKILEKILGELPSSEEVNSQAIKYSEKILPPSYAMDDSGELNDNNFETRRTAEDSFYEGAMSIISKVKDIIKSL